MPGEKIPPTTFVALGVMLAIGGAAFWFTHANVLPDWLRWGVTGAWLLYTIILGIRDFAVGSDPTSRDTVPFDLWTISHGGAGLVFGVWYMPFLVVLGLTVLWEVFEAIFRGFGDKEDFKNRAVDVGIALVLWAVVVVPAKFITDTPFPFLLPYRP